MLVQTIMDERTGRSVSSGFYGIECDVLRSLVSL